jgi:membrane-associated phospholipid phosphatase
MGSHSRVARASGCWKRFSRDYTAGDFLVAVLFWCLTGVVDLLPTRHREIIDGDPSIRYPYLNPTVPTWLLIVLCIPVPLLIMTLVSWIRYVRHRDELFAKAEATTGCAALFLAGGMSTFFTTVIKHLVGRPRPNFVKYCQWLSATGCGNPTPDAWASFVSGHASLAFATLTILSLYFLTLLRSSRRAGVPFVDCGACSPDQPRAEYDAERALIARRTELATAPDNVAWVYAISLLPMVLAGWIALTRITDYWHNTDDVLGGVMLGAGCAFMVGRFKLKVFETMQPRSVNSVNSVNSANSANLDGDLSSTSPSNSPSYPPLRGVSDSDVANQV